MSAPIYRLPGTCLCAYPAEGRMTVILVDGSHICRLNREYALVVVGHHAPFVDRETRERFVDHVLFHGLVEAV